jgi:diadenosine tetraphosphate (Ap4A) HIT family hydrolase
LNDAASPFVDPAPEDVVLRNALCYARWDRYPVTEGHLLVVPFRRFASYFEASAAEREALWALVEEARRFLDARYRPDGYNIGINVGAAAGQTVMHLHVHLIPRRFGDSADPRGGVRGVIAARQKY